MNRTTVTEPAARGFALEALFTPEWTAIYDPVTRERWDAAALLDQELVEALCATHLTPIQQEQLCVAGVVAEQPYSVEDSKQWVVAGWSDALRHYLHTNMLPKLNYSSKEGWLEDFATMRTKVSKEPAPALSKHYDMTEQRIRLAVGAPGTAFHDVMSQDPRQTAKNDLQFDELASLLVEVFGVSGYKNLAVTGEHVRKTSPSGGSRHPTEAYVLVFDVAGLVPGIYHFDARDHELALLRKENVFDEYMSRVLGLNRRVSFKPKAAVVLTSIVERSMHRYRDSRSYRVLHFDVGHLLLSCQLVARALGLSYFSAYSVADTAVEELIGIDGLFETAMTQVVLA